MSSSITSFQERSWNNFIQHGLKEMLEQAGVEDPKSGVKIDYKLLNQDELQDLDVQYMDKVRNFKTYTKPVKVLATVTLNKAMDLGRLARGEERAMLDTTYNKELTIMQMPILTGMGFIIDGQRYEVVSRFKKALGWYVLQKKYLTLELDTQYGGKYAIGMNNHRLVVNYKGTRNDSKSIGLETFLKAISPFLLGSTGLSNDEILSKIGQNFISLNKSLDTVSEETVQQAQITMVKSFYNPNFKGDSKEASERVYNQLFNPRVLGVGKESRVRFQQRVSYGRLVGLELAKDLDKYKKGDIITTRMAMEFDENEVPEVWFKSEQGKVFKTNTYKAKENLTAEEIYMAVQCYCLALEGVGGVDDVDSLENKVLEPVDVKFSHQIQNNLRMLTNHIINSVGTLKDLETIMNIKEDGMIEGLTGKDKFAFEPDKLIEQVKQDSEVQISEETNIMSRMSKGYKITMTSKDINDEARYVQPNQKGRICPIETAEGKGIGRTVTLTSMAEIDDAGFITTPYYEVKDGKIVSEPIHYNAVDERDKYIANFSVDLTAEFADVTINGEVRQVSTKEIDLMMVSPLQVISPAASMIPGIDNDHLRRALMATGMTRQAVAPIKPERSLVTTGSESLMNVGVVTAEEIIKDVCRTNALNEEDTQQVLTEAVINITKTFKGDSSRKYIFEVEHPKVQFKNVVQDLASFQNTMKKTSINYKLNGAGPWKNGDIVLHSHDVDVKECSVSGDAKYGENYKIPKDLMEKKSLALGKNMKVLFKFHEGSGYEDAIIINQDFIDRKAMSMVFLKNYHYEIDSAKNTYNDFSFTSKLTKVDSEKTKHLEENGLPKRGTYLKSGQIIIGVDAVVKVTNDNNEVTFDKKDKSVLVSGTDAGYVVDAYISKDRGITRATVVLACIKDVESGDKLAGRHGNKGVIGRVVPREDMPYMEDGTVPDMILSPLGVPSRMNIGQLVESLAGWVADQTGNVQVIESFTGKTIDKLKTLSEAEGLKPVDVYDGRTGNKFPRQMMYGVMYFLRLEHMVSTKVHAINQAGGNINIKTMQPKPGKKMNGGQKIGELASWSLLSHGANRLTDDFFSLHADDMTGKDNLRKQIMDSEENISLEGNNQSEGIILAYLRQFGVNVGSEADGLGMSPLTEQDIINLADGNKINLTDINKTDNGILKELHRKDVFGDPNGRGTENILRLRSTYSRIELPQETVMPLWIDSNEWCSNFYVHMMRKPTKTETTDKKDDCVVSTRNGSVFKVNRKLKSLSVQTMKALIEEEAYIVAVEDAPKTFSKLGVVQVNESKTRYVYIPAVAMKGNAGKRKQIDLSEIGINDEVDAVVLTGMKAVIEMLRNSDFQDYVLFLNKELESIVNPKEKNKINQAAEKLKKKIFYIGKFLESSLEDYIVKSLLVIPSGYRSSDLNGETQRKSTFDKFYVNVILTVLSLQKEDSKDKRLAFWKALSMSVASKVKSKGKDRDVTTLMSEFTVHKNKSAVLRDHTLGKRVEFSGRSTITPNSNLTLGQCGVPYKMAFSLWEIHLATIITRDCKMHPKLSHKTATKLVKIIANQDLEGYRIEFHGKDVVNLTEDFRKTEAELKAMLREFTKDKPVVLNREPSLHKFSIQAFFPVLVDGLSIQVHPLICTGFNADFDGDAMGIFVPQTKEAIQDAIDKMMIDSNIINPGNGEIILQPEQDMALGCYTATMFKANVVKVPLEERVPKIFARTKEQLELQIELGNLTMQDWCVFNHEGRLYHNTVGRVLFNCLYPQGKGFTETKVKTKVNNEEREWNRYELKYDTLMTKGKLKDVSKDILTEFGDKELLTYLDQMMAFGFWASDISGVSIHMLDLQSEDAKGAEDLAKAMKAQEAKVADVNDMYDLGFLGEHERKKQNVEMWSNFHGEIKDGILNSLGRDNNLFIIIDSGSRGNKSQLMETLGMLGNIEGPNGEPFETPIKSNFATGLNIDDYFISSLPARKNSVAQAMETADVGELTRNIILILQDIRIGNETHLMIEHENGDKVQACDSEGRKVKLEYKIDLDSMKLSENDPNYEKLKDTLTAENNITPATKKLIFELGIKSIKSPSGEEKVKIKLQDISRVLLFKRSTGEDLPYLDRGTITNKTLAYIQEQRMTEVQVYTTMDCHTVDAVCQRCFGLNYESTKFPNIGDSVGFKSAQAIGEPSSQLTLDSIHRTNTGGGRSGVEVVRQLVNLTGQSVDEVDVNEVSRFEVLADINGTVKLKERGKDKLEVTVYANKSDAEAHQDDQDIVDEVNEEETVYVDKQVFTTFKDLILVEDGDEVKEGQPLTFGQRNYKHMLANNGGDIQEVQQKMVEDYANTYLANNLKVLGRHFELLVKMQTQFVRVLDEKKSNFSRYETTMFGKVWEYNKQQSDEEELVEYEFLISGKNKILEQSPNFMTAISDGYLKSRAVRSAVERKVDAGKSPISKMAIGNPTSKVDKIKEIFIKPTEHKAIVSEEKVNADKNEGIFGNVQVKEATKEEPVESVVVDDLLDFNFEDEIDFGSEEVGVSEDDIFNFELEDTGFNTGLDDVKVGKETNILSEE